MRVNWLLFGSNAAETFLLTVVVTGPFLANSSGVGSVTVRQFSAVKD